MLPRHRGIAVSQLRGLLPHARLTRYPVLRGKDHRIPVLQRSSRLHQPVVPDALQLLPREDIRERRSELVLAEIAFERACLLTGRNHHTVGMASITEVI